MNTNVAGPDSRSSTSHDEMGSFENVANDNPGLRRCWHPVALADSVSDSPVHVSLLGIDYVVVRFREGLRAFVDRCPHRWAPLSEGRLIDNLLVCPYHGYCFREDGDCVRVPALRQGVPVPLRTVLVPPDALQERYGLIWIAPESPSRDLPSIPEWDDERFAHVVIDPTDWAADASLVWDNFCDVTHFPFLHETSFGNREDLVVDKENLVVHRENAAVFWEYLHSTNVALHQPGVTPIQRRTMTSEYHPPFLKVNRIDYPDIGLQHTSLLAGQPAREGHTVVYMIVLRSDVAEGRTTADSVREYELRTLREDRWIIEKLSSRYGADAVPLSLPRQTHTAADRQSIEFRRALAETVQGHAS